MPSRSKSSPRPAAKDLFIDLEIHDNSEIEDYCKCERKHYFRHVRGFTAEAPSDSLSFGDSWHKAMDAVWEAICWDGVDDRTAIELGIDAFLERWTELGYPSPQEFASWGKLEQDSLSPRTPLVAMEMIFSYVDMRSQFLRGIELLSIEEPFVVPIDPDNPKRMYAGKMDKVMRRDGKIIGVDHKTTSWYAKNGYFRMEFLESFHPNRQFPGYLHNIKMRWGKQAKEVWADCALVHKNVHEGFRFIPSGNQMEHLPAWFWETHVRFDMIEQEAARLRSLRERWANGEEMKPVLEAYPRRPESCFLYQRPCEFLDMCRAWLNPEAYDEPPDGFKVEYWSPFEEEDWEKLREQMK